MKDRFFGLLGTCGMVISLAAMMPTPIAYGSGCNGPRVPICTATPGCVPASVTDPSCASGGFQTGICTGTAPTCGCKTTTDGCVCK